jgi:2-polyprenyl-3-methyl-5-hydroxy-6-metoxy-1,4-benzoquinol methylase
MSALPKEQQTENAQACPVCGGSSTLWVKLPSVTLFRCGACDHCFTDLATIVKAEEYGSDYFQKTHRNWFENPNYALFDMLAKEIARHKSRSVLDVGCGNGAFLKYLAKSAPGLDLHGLDLSDAPEASPGIKFLKGDFLAYPFQSKYDAIVTLAVIEHLGDVNTFARRIHELLNKDGMACVMTLNESGLLYRFANLLRKTGISMVFVRLYDPHHLNHFSKASLTKLLTKDGLFKLDKIIDHNTTLAAIDVPASSAVKRFILKAGVAGIFLLGKLTRQTYLQTIVVTKVG